MIKLKKCPNIFIASYCDCKDGECQATNFLQQEQLLTEIMNDDAKDGLYEDKPFKYASVREVTDKWEQGEISYGKMVEMLNDIAIKWHNESNPRI